MSEKRKLMDRCRKILHDGDPLMMPSYGLHKLSNNDLELLSLALINLSSQITDLEETISGKYGEYSDC